MEKNNNIKSERKNNKKISVITIAIVIALLVACVICGGLEVKKLYIDQAPAKLLLGDGVELGKSEKEYLEKLDSENNK